MQDEDFPPDTPHLGKIRAGGDGRYANGGSCVAAPDGTWLVEPVAGEERHLMDPAGHYSRPDVTRLAVDRRRQATVEMTDAGAAGDS